jgi:hypothetical protein
LPVHLRHNAEMDCDVRAVPPEGAVLQDACMDAVGTLVIAISALLVLDLAAPHLAGDGRSRRRPARRGFARR